MSYIIGRSNNYVDQNRPPVVNNSQQANNLQRSQTTTPYSATSMSVLLGKSVNKEGNRVNDSRILDSSINYSGKKSLWSKYTNHQVGPLSRAYSMALNNSRATNNKPRPPGLINCIKTIIEHNKRKLITPDNALSVFGNNEVTTPQGKRGYGTAFSMVKILRP